MISVKEADKLIQGNIWTPETEQISIHDALGRVLSENIDADRPFPPFDRATMDGITIQFSSFQNGNRRFPIEGVIPAGSPTQSLKNNNACLEIMTGAVLPPNADTIIPYEKIHIVDRMAVVDEISLKKGSSIHPEGKDCDKGTVLIPKYCEITAAEIAILATVGKSEIEVFRRPRIAIIATGDELVHITADPLPYQIRSSNVYMLQARLQEIQLESKTYHIKDNEKVLREKMANLLHDNDVLILSGGVSKGKFDFVPQVLENLGVKKIFHRVRQKPGKPFWFGRKENVFIFALPGNPISSFLCLNRYFMNWYTTSFRQSSFLQMARLSEDYIFSKPLTYFLQVKAAINQDGCLIAHPNTGNGSGDLANFSQSTGFLELPLERNTFKKGEVFPYYPFKI